MTARPQRRPGLGEILRLNGTACVTVDEAVLLLFDGELRRPASAIGVEIEHAYLHCAKSFRRGGLWDPERWPTVEGRPSVGRILVDHAGVGDRISGDQLEEMLEEGYAEDLAADLPESGSRRARTPTLRPSVAPRTTDR